MKKTLCLLFALCILLSAEFSASANEYIAVYLNGTQLEFDVSPSVIDGRTLVPLRAIFEKIGASVEWEDEAKIITAKKDDTVIKMQIDNNIMTKNTDSIALDVPPITINDRTLVPVRAVAEAFGAEVQWSEKNNSVIINTDGLKTYEDFPNIPDLGEICGLQMVNMKTSDNTTLISYKVDENYNDSTLRTFVEGVLKRGFEFTEEERETYLSIGSQFKTTCYPNTTLWIDFISTSVFGVHGNLSNINLEITTDHYNLDYIRNKHVLGLSAEEKTNVYHLDGRMLTVPKAEVHEWIINGWFETFPYAGEKLWVDKYLLDSESRKGRVCDIYDGQVSFREFDDYKHQIYIPIKVDWYDDQDFLILDSGEIKFKYLIFDVAGGKYKMDFDLFSSERDDVNIIRNTTVESLEGWEWDCIQKLQIELGMSTAAIEVMNGEPDDITKTTNVFGVSEVWVYKWASKTEYYYFTNGVLTSWKEI